MNHSMKSYNGTSKAVERRKGALARLEEQLKTKQKPLESARSERVMQDLTPVDIKRITKEIEILKTRV